MGNMEDKTMKSHEDREMNMPREQTTIRLPAEFKERIQQEADRRGDSFNETVIRLLQKALESNR